MARQADTATHTWIIPLPANADLDWLKAEAKALLRAARAGEPGALGRFAAHLPAAHGRDPDPTTLKLHDAQSVIARAHGLSSWAELKRRVEWQRADRAARQGRWAAWVYEGGSQDRRRALAMLTEDPDLLAGDTWLACAIGDMAAIAAALARDPLWANRPGGPKAMPPLVAVTHSRLIGEKALAPALLESARLLLAHGADPDARWTDPRFPDAPLSALFGAAGRNHHAAMTALLLEAGADPDDNESLYHASESRDPACLRLLLAAGARVEGTNALARMLDFDDLGGLALLLAHAKTPPDAGLMHHAILRGRSLAHVRALLDDGADPRQPKDDTSLARWAALNGRDDVLALLHERGIKENLIPTDALVAACARADEAGARALLAKTPGLLADLGPAQLETMPRLAALGALPAVRLMLTLGWPREVTTAWHATALNLAVFRGDAAMTRLLLAAGADWRTPHGHGDTVIGTLSFASRADDIDPDAPRDFTGCLNALLAAGIPREAFEGRSFSDEIAARLKKTA